MINLYVHIESKGLSVRYFTVLATCVCFALAHPGMSFPPQAQAVAPITPSGLNTQVNLTATPPPGQTQYDITGGTRPGGGANLFHSFGDFKVPPNNIANFLNETGLPTSNILARVTGSSGNNPTLSSIYGTIQTTNFPGANLFLMNPAGFLFGANATVNVNGMVAFTTANSMRLSDGITNGYFYADLAVPSLLTSAPVAAFGFIAPTIGPITVGPVTVYGMTVQGPMPTDPNTGAPLSQKVALVGGNMTFTSDPESGAPSTITAPGRQIQITSVAGAGEVAANSLLPAAGMVLGTVTLNPGTVISTAGDPLFGDGSGGSISIRGGQFVATGATIATSPAVSSPGLGGDVTVSVTGSATFTSSMIQTSPVVFSFAGNAGAVSITANDNLSMTNTTIDASSFFAAGDAGPVTLHTNGTLFLTDSHIFTNASAPGNGGAVTITGKDVTFTRTSISTDVDTGFFDASVDPALGQVRPGAVTITAQDTVTLSGTGVPTPIISATAVGTLLDAGSVTVTGKTVNLSNGTINTTLSDGNIVSPANGGTIKIHGNDVSLTQFWLLSNGEKSPQSSGTGGSILLRGSDNLRADNIQLANSRLSSAAGGGGGGGPIEFQTKALTISDHTDVGTSSFGTGAGGTVTVKGAENVTIQSGSRVLTDVVNGLASESPVGSAGNVLIETQNLTLRSGGQIGARALPLSTGNAGNITVQGNSVNPAQSILIDGTGSGIFSTAEGTGAGGNILVNAASVTLQNGGALSAVTSGSASSATGGTIKVDATNTVTMNSASITSSSMGVADAGSIDLTAMNGFSMQNSTITTLAGQGASGGNIKVTTSPAATVWLQNSKISASVADGQGGGGNISIDPQFVILQNSQILAQAAQGQGGAITITTNLFLPDANSIVNADSGSGTNGTVTIQSPNAPISGQIQPLGKSPLLATSLLNQRCASLAGGEFSSFTVAGRDSLPTEPGSWLASPLALGPAGFSADAVAEAGAQAHVIDPAQETTVLSLRQIAPAGFLTQAFAIDWSASCQS